MPPVASRRIFTLAEARAVVPELLALTQGAAERFEAARTRQRTARQRSRREVAERQMRAEVKAWQQAIRALGGCCAGLWLVRFDSGAGWYCWQFPEPDLSWFYSYAAGFAGRERIH
jgi:hypothetical protein